MSKYDENTVSAAISDLGEMLVIENKVNVHDIDSMAKASVQAEELVKNELLRSGMSLIEATQLIDSASSKTARSTPESQNLTDTSLQNQFVPVVVSNDEEFEEYENDHDDDDHKGSKTEAQAEEITQKETNNNDDEDVINSSKKADQTTQGKSNQKSSPAQPKKSLQQKNVNKERAQILGELIPYKVEMKKVHEIFRGIPKDQEIFNFEVPYFTWKKKHPLVPQLDMAYNMEVESLLTCLYAISTKRSTALVGPHGCGKTKLVEQIGARLNMPVIVIPMDGQMSRSHLFGQEKLRATDSGTESYYQYGVLPSAMLEPGIIMFDEFDRADESVQYACHSVYEQTHLTLLEHDGRKIPVHQYNRIFGTANTKGRGSDDGMYLGGNEMSEATRDRWSVWIDMDYQGVEDDIMVLEAKVKDLPAEERKVIARLAGQIREAFKNSSLSQTCSMRQQLETAEYASFLIKTTKTNNDEERLKCLRLAIERIIMGRANDSDRGAIETMIKTIAPKAYEGDPIIS